MQRRHFLQLTALGSVALGSATLIQSGFGQGKQVEPVASGSDGFHDELSGSQLEPKDHLYESRLPKSAPDLVATGHELALLERVEARLRRVMQWVGFGNFNIIGFDSVLRFAQTVESIGAFTPEELDFIEALFARDAKAYGFFGDRVIDRLTAEVDNRSVFKVPASGHYLYRGDSERVYEQIKSDVGESIILTSGVRSVTKQLHLFMAKALSEGGNYTEASRSLAPAGYSYHGIGDFDVGKVGFGARNFTSEFAKTREFEKLMKLGYVAIRYPEGNPYGVYFEPWHIEVV